MKRERQTKARKETPVPTKEKRDRPVSSGAVSGMEGRRRVVIEHVRPEIDAGRFPIKRIVGESVVVEADVFADGHDEITGALRYRRGQIETWTDVPLEFVENDRWRASFEVAEQGLYYYTVVAWVDHFRSWQRDMRKRITAGQGVTVDLMIGRDRVKAAGQHAAGKDAGRLATLASALENREDRERALEIALGPELSGLMAGYAERPWPTQYDRELAVVVDRDKAGFSSWYELFPRSCTDDPARHGTFKDCEARLPYVAEMGFDVLYVPPIHPIGMTHRKGPNNSPTPSPTD